MNNPAEVLKRIEGLPVPRHIFVLPDWAEPGVLDRLMDQGYLTCAHHQRDANGDIQLAMSLNLTLKGHEAMCSSHPKWPGLALKASVAGLSFALMSVLVLYLG